MSTQFISDYSGPGRYGQQAAARFKAVLPQNRHAVPIQYTPNIQAGSADLFAYCDSFKKNKDVDVFTATDIEEASGLDVSKLPPDQSIEKLWDLDGNGHVDSKEMFTGMAHLDWADGEFDGKITEAGRNALETSKFKSPRSEQAQQPFAYNQAGASPEATSDALNQLDLSNPSSQADLTTKATVLTNTLSNYGPRPNDTFNDPTAMLAAHAANPNDPLVAGFSTSFWNNARQLQGLQGQNVADTFHRQNQALIARQDQEARAQYQQELRQAGSALNVSDKLQAFNAKNTAQTGPSA
jgi:hypothetical protein